MDKFSIEDLEVIPCGSNKVTFAQGYYFCPLLAKEETVVEFKRIKYTYILQDEKPEKFFELKEKKPTHFYLKVVLEDKAMDIESLPYDEDQDSWYSRGLEPKFYKAKSVEISNDEICQPNDVGYPFFEKVSKDSELPTVGYKGRYDNGSEFTKEFKDVITYEFNKPGAFSKKNKVFYIYFCSLYLEDNIVSRLFYYMAKGSKDPAIVIPNPIKLIISNRHQTDIENDKTVVVRNAVGGRIYKDPEHSQATDFKERDFGDDKNDIYIDIKYNKRNEIYQNMYFDSNGIANRCISDAMVAQDGLFVPNSTVTDTTSPNLPQSQLPFTTYIDDRFTFSPYPIVGISEIKQTTLTSTEGGDYSPAIIG